VADDAPLGEREDRRLRLAEIRQRPVAQRLMRAFREAMCNEL
jgi:hypothetical protein